MPLDSPSLAGDLSADERDTSEPMDSVRVGGRLTLGLLVGSFCKHMRE